MTNSLAANLQVRPKSLAVLQGAGQSQPSGIRLELQFQCCGREAEFQVGPPVTVHIHHTYVCRLYSVELEAVGINLSDIQIVCAWQPKSDERGGRRRHRASRRSQDVYRSRCVKNVPGLGFLKRQLGFPVSLQVRLPSVRGERTFLEDREISPVIMAVQWNIEARWTADAKPNEVQIDSQARSGGIAVSVPVHRAIAGRHVVDAICVTVEEQIRPAGAQSRGLAQLSSFVEHSRRRPPSGQELV